MQQPQNITLSKARSRISTPESSGYHGKVTPVSDYRIPQTMSEHYLISRTIRRQVIQDIRREIPAHADPICSPPKPIEIPLQAIPRKCKDSDIDALEQDINMDFEEHSPYQEGVISET